MDFFLQMESGLMTNLTPDLKNTLRANQLISREGPMEISVEYPLVCLLVESQPAMLKVLG